MANNGKATIREVYALQKDLHSKMDKRDEKLYDEITLLKTEIRGIKSFAGGVSFSVSTLITVVGLIIGWRKG